MKGMSETVSTASNAADAWTNPLRDPRDLRLPRIAGPCSIVIFGVTGDLSRKKLLPAIYDLANRGLLPPSFGLTGFARRDWTEDHFKDFVKENVQAHCRTPFKESTWKQLAAGIRFVQGTFDDPKAFERLSDTVAELDRDRGTRGNHAFYMSVPPRAFPQVSRQLADCGLAKSSEGAWRRVIIEKPFGHDLASAKELDRVVSEVFDPSSVFRIDHYLGKETVQNMLALRFANAMYEPIWNNNYVDHVQITMAEDIGVAGRAGYYDGIGAARDIIQNHLLQLMALTAMEEPVSFSAADLTAEKTKVLSAVRLPKDLAAHTARGQYAAGWQGSHEVVGYLDEKGIDPESTTETYAAIRLDVDTRRWAGVPFYLRTGKRLGKRVTEIAVLGTICRIKSAVNHRLYFLISWKCFCTRSLIISYCITDSGISEVLDTCCNVSDHACCQLVTWNELTCAKITYLYNFCRKSCCHHTDLSTFLNAAVHNTTKNNDAFISIINRVKDQCLQRCIYVSLRCRDLRNDLLQNFLYIQSCLG